MTCVLKYTGRLANNLEIFGDDSGQGIWLMTGVIEITLFVTELFLFKICGGENGRRSRERKNVRIQLGTSPV